MPPPLCKIAWSRLRDLIDRSRIDVVPASPLWPALHSPEPPPAAGKAEAGKLAPDYEQALSILGNPERRIRFHGFKAGQDASVEHWFLRSNQCVHFSFDFEHFVVGPVRPAEEVLGRIADFLTKASVGLSSHCIKAEVFEFMPFLITLSTIQPQGPMTVQRAAEFFAELGIAAADWDELLQLGLDNKCLKLDADGQIRVAPKYIEILRSTDAEWVFEIQVLDLVDCEDLRPETLSGRAKSSLFVGQPGRAFLVDIGAFKTGPKRKVTLRQVPRKPLEALLLRMLDSPRGK
jgi:hypothetical protein